jgi:hypothetical protein
LTIDGAIHSMTREDVLTGNDATLLASKQDH